MNKRRELLIRNMKSGKLWSWDQSCTLKVIFQDLCPPLSNPGQVEVELVVLLKLPLQIFTLARAPPTSCTCYTSTAIVGLGNQAQK